MALFGSMFGRRRPVETAPLADVAVTPARDTFATMPVQPAGGLTQPAMLRTADLNTQAPQVSISQPRRGLFGSGWDSNRMMTLGASLQDAGAALDGRAGGHLEALAETRKADAERKAKRDAFAEAYDPATGRLDPNKLIAAYSTAGADLPSGVVSSLIKPEERARPRLFQTRSGDIIAIGEDDAGEFTNQTVFDAPEPERKAPTGMRYNEQGVLEWEPGFLDAQLALAGGRRDAVVSRPMPSRASGGGGGSGAGGSSVPPPPSGYRIVSP